MMTANGIFHPVKEESIWTKLRSISIFLFTIFSIVCLNAQVAEAQFCWEGSQLPKCKIFLVLELSYYRTMNESNFDENHFAGEVGIMRNLNQQNSIGALLFVGFEPEKRGIRIRYRRWLRNRISINLSPGLLITNHVFLIESPTLTGELNLNYHDLIIFSYRLDRLKYNQAIFSGFQGDSKTQHYMGVKTASKTAAVVGGTTGAVVLILLGLLVAACSSGGCYGG